MFGCDSKQPKTYIYEKLDHSVEYIDPAKASYNTDFLVCDEHQIYNYYNPEKATYSKGKNKLREFIMNNYDKKSYTDSGYLNIHFVINCNGETGRYKVYENDLNLEPYSFHPDLKTQLLELTKKLGRWNPNVIRGQKKDAYMYISYKLKNGEIIEILP